MPRDHHVDDRAFQDLSGGSLWEFVPDLDVLRNLEVRDLVLAELLERVGRYGLLRFQADDCLDAVTPDWIRQAEHRNLVHCRVLGKQVLDLGGKYVVAAGLDAELGTIAEIDVAGL